MSIVDVPRPGPGEVPDGHVQLRYLTGGLCGSDGPSYRGDVTPWGDPCTPVPGSPLHEIVGEVVVSRTDRLEVGDRVVGWATRSDGLQEYVVSDGSSLAVYDRGLHHADAIVLQPLACVLDAVGKLGDVRDLHCAVLGQGPIGVLFSHVLRDAGARRVTGVDRVDRRAELAPFGVDDARFLTSGVWAAKLEGTARSAWSADPGDDRPDVVVEAVGHQTSTLNHAIRAIRPGGRIHYFGVPDDACYPIDMERMLRKNLTLRAGWCTADRVRVLQQAGAYLRRYPELCGLLVTSRFPVERAAEAYAAAFTPTPGRLKVVITTG